MTKTKTPPRCTITGTAKKQSIAKSSNCILSLKRTAVKFGIVAGGVYTVAAVGQLQLFAAAVGIIATNTLCGLILKQEKNHYEKI